MNNSYDECHLFGILRKPLRQDLVSCHGLSNPAAGAILNWFDPSDSEYLTRVDDWQVSLCKGFSPKANPIPYHLNAFGNYDLFEMPNHLIGAIHQVAKLLYKWHGTPRKETNMDEVKSRLHRPLPITLETFEVDGIRRCLSGICPPDLEDVVGRFGPGLTSEGFSTYDKWTRRGYIPPIAPQVYRVNDRDPWTPAGFTSGTTKIAEVPKSIKSNRTVSSEPAMYMYAQLAVAGDLDRQIHELFGQYVSLHDAELHNRYLLRDGACSIDLSDASDHVSVDLVMALLPQLWPVLAAVRSSYAAFPDGEKVLLGTFAPMGSGVCFPILTIVCLGILLYGRIIALREGLLKPRDAWLHVYGDDIIVPVGMYDIATDLLTRAGLVVNINKSCCTGFYRESCGREMYLGYNCTPAYIRDPLETLPASKVEDLYSRLVANSFPHTAQAVAELSNCIRDSRYDPKLQRLELCVRTVSARQKISSLDGWDGLMRWFSLHTQQGMRITPKGVAFEPSGAPVEVWTKQAWRYRSSLDYPYLSTWFATR